MTLTAAVVGTGFGCQTHVQALRRAGFDGVAAMAVLDAIRQSAAEGKWVTVTSE
jgi:hypothetical protein